MILAIADKAISPFIDPAYKHFFDLDFPGVQERLYLFAAFFEAYAVK